MMKWKYFESNLVKWGGGRGPTGYFDVKKKKKPVTLDTWLRLVPYRWSSSLQQAPQQRLHTVCELRFFVGTHRSTQRPLSPFDWVVGGESELVMVADITIYIVYTNMTITSSTNHTTNVIEEFQPTFKHIAGLDMSWSACCLASVTTRCWSGCRLLGGEELGLGSFVETVFG